MKNTKTTYLFIYVIFIIFSSGVIASEPKSIDPKDLIDKLDRSELQNESSEAKLENIIPEFEIPKLDFNDSVEIHKQTKTTITPETSTTPEVSKKPETSKKSRTLKKTTAKSTNKPSTPKEHKNTVIFAKRPIGIKQLLKNDKIVINKGNTYVYRLIGTKITQYKINDKIPLKSTGLKINGKNNYYVVDVGLLRSDAKTLNAQTKPIKKKQTAAMKRKAQRKNKANQQKKQQLKKAVVKKETETGVGVSPEILAKRKAFEERFNYGKAIKKSLVLKKLQVNDEITVSGTLQFVVRRNKSTSGVKKYWLTEKLDTTSKNLFKKSKNTYKVINRF